MKRFAFLIVILFLLTGPVGSVIAAPLLDTTVGEGETVNNDVIVFDGDLDIENGAVVNGDVVVFNGDVAMAGTVNGDLVIFNGDLQAEGSASVNGDCVLLNGDVEDGSNTGIRCTQIEGGVLPGIMAGIAPFAEDAKAIPDVPDVPAVPDVPDVPAVPAVPDVPDVPGVRHNQRTNAGIDFGGVLSSTLLLGLLAFGTGTLFPNHLRQVKATVRSKPVASGAVGVLTAIAVPILASILAIISAVLTIICIGLLGFPIVLLVVLALVAGAIMGWIAVGTWLGEKFVKDPKRSLAMKAALGTMVLTFGLGMFGMLPFVWGEGILVAMVGAVGLGAVALTQFGRKPYPPEEELMDVSEDAVKVATVLETLPDDDLH